jgi:hypothetical protein
MARSTVCTKDLARYSPCIFGISEYTGSRILLISIGLAWMDAPIPPYIHRQGLFELAMVQLEVAALQHLLDSYIASLNRKEFIPDAVVEDSPLRQEPDSEHRRIGCPSPGSRSLLRYHQRPLECPPSRLPAWKQDGLAWEQE